MKSVLVILLNWNGWRDTVACLTSLEKTNYRNFRVIVVDNGSTDDSVPQIRSAFPDVSIVEAGKNLGFAGGCNVGIRQALEEGAEYVWLLNNDTIVDTGTLRAMVKKAETDPKIGAMGSVIYSMQKPQTMQAWGGGYVNFILGRSGHYTAPVSDEELQFITGASLLLRRRALEEVGLLDQEFFMYWEDADYCFRLRRAGWRLAVAGESKIWHKEQGSFGEKNTLLDRYFSRSAVRFFEKNASVPFISVWIGVAIRITRRVMSGDWKRIRAVWAGAVHSRTTR